jgi:heme/copper-type cytochrome/quinol oxidase subunit 3
MTNAIDLAIASAPHEVARASEPGKLGMWIFIAGETMLFGGLMEVFILLGMQRGGWGIDGTRVTWRLAAVNTVILVTSSLMASLAQAAASIGDSGRARRYLQATTFVGSLFLLIKGFEYAGDIGEGLTPRTGVFWSFYYLMTGLHVLHLLAGIVVILGLSLMVTPRTSANWLERKLKYVCLYWYFVETVWVFLFAVIYVAPGAK